MTGPRTTLRSPMLPEQLEAHATIFRRGYARTATWDDRNRASDAEQAFTAILDSYQAMADQVSKWRHEVDSTRQAHARVSEERDELAVLLYRRTESLHAEQHYASFDRIGLRQSSKTVEQLREEVERLSGLLASSQDAAGEESSPSLAGGEPDGETSAQSPPAKPSLFFIGQRIMAYGMLGTVTGFGTNAPEGSVFVLAQMDKDAPGDTTNWHHSNLTVAPLDEFSTSPAEKPNVPNKEADTEPTSEWEQALKAALDYGGDYLPNSTVKNAGYQALDSLLATLRTERERWDNLADEADHLLSRAANAEQTAYEREHERDVAKGGMRTWQEIGVRNGGRAERAERELARLREALDWIEAEPEDPIKVQLWARAALAPSVPVADKTEQA